MSFAELFPEDLWLYFREILRNSKKFRHAATLAVGSSVQYLVLTDSTWKIEFAQFVSLVGFYSAILQGWEFAHRFSQQIANFLPKNERMSDFLKQTSDSLIRSFLVSNQSDSLTIAHFHRAMWANRSWSLIFGEWPERFTHIAHQKEGMSDSLIF